MNQQVGIVDVTNPRKPRFIKRYPVINVKKYPTTEIIKI
jgi:hypothetical protein